MKTPAAIHSPSACDAALLYRQTDLVERTFSSMHCRQLCIIEEAGKTVVRAPQ